ncbi:MAG: hypothetical protein ABI137_07405 [Antricoccus sp.]
MPLDTNRSIQTGGSPNASSDRLFASSAIVRHRGFTAPQVFRSTDDRDYLEVVVGPLSIRAYDQAAVESLAQGWDRALLLAQTMWSGEEPRTNTASIAKVMKNRGMPPILQKGIPTVFDISQTDLIDGAHDPYAQLCELPGEDAAGLTDAIVEYLRGQGWNLTIAPTAAAMDGYTQHTTRRIVIADHLSAAQTAATLLHEAEHALLQGEPRRGP